MKIVVVSAHPDDAETAAGDLIAIATRAGHEAVILHRLLRRFFKSRVSKEEKISNGRE